MRADLTFANIDETDRFADRLAAAAQPGLTILLDGPVGAGKTTLARRLIQTCMRNADVPIEDVPSPTFTIVQNYEAGPLEIWHADLYRLNASSELTELGLDAAFETAFCIIEWPDRLGDMAPQALRIDLDYGTTDDTRHCHLSGSSPQTEALVALLTKEAAP